MINSKFGTPDPSWDYNELWESLINAHTNLEELIRFITNLEDSTPENDKAIAEKLQIIIASLKEANHFD